MDSPSHVYFGCSEPSDIRCDRTISHASSQSVATELSSLMLWVCDPPHQVLAKDCPFYEVEAMSLIHGQIARLAWRSIMAASRGKVLTLYARRSVHFVWAPLMFSAGTLEGIGLFYGVSYDCNQRRVSFPVYRSKTDGLFSSSYGALRIWRNASGGASEPDAEQDYILLR